MDDADRAEDKIEAAIESGIEHARYMIEKTRLTACGACHYCGEGLRDGLLFCDSDCSTDYRYEQDRKKAQGRL